MAGLFSGKGREDNGCSYPPLVGRGSNILLGRCFFVKKKRKFPLVCTTSEQSANGEISALPNIKGGVGRDKVALISTPGTARKKKKKFETMHCISLSLFVSFCISNSYDTPEWFFHGPPVLLSSEPWSKQSYLLIFWERLDCKQIHNFTWRCHFCRSESAFLCILVISRSFATSDVCSWKYHLWPRKHSSAVRPSTAKRLQRYRSIHRPRTKCQDPHAHANKWKQRLRTTNLPTDILPSIFCLTLFLVYLAMSREGCNGAFSSPYPTLLQSDWTFAKFKTENEDLKK